MGPTEVDRITEGLGDCESLSDLVEQYIHNNDEVGGRIWLLAELRSGACVSEESSCIFVAVSVFRSGTDKPQLHVRSTVRSDVLEASTCF